MSIWSARTLLTMNWEDWEDETNPNTGASNVHDLRRKRLPTLSTRTGVMYGKRVLSMFGSIWTGRSNTASISRAIGIGRPTQSLQNCILMQVGTPRAHRRL